MDSPVPALPVAVNALVLDLAATPLSELLSGDLVGSVCGEVAETLGVAGAACLVCGPGGVVAAGWSDSRAGSLARLQAEEGQGPAVRAVRDARTVVETDLVVRERDPHTARALALQVGSTVAAPLRCAETVSGCLQLYLGPGRPPTAELVAGTEALARVLGTLASNVELYRRSAQMTAHLSEVLTSRAPVEQAKGVLAERHDVGMGEAFGLLRAQARRRRLTVAAVAHEVLSAVPHGPPTVFPDATPRPVQGAVGVPGPPPAPPPSVPAGEHRRVRVSRRSPDRSTGTTPGDAQHPSRGASSLSPTSRSTDPATT